MYASPKVHDKPSAADVILVIDDSESMNSAKAWLPKFIQRLEKSLQDREIGSNGVCQNKYAVVAFGHQPDGAVYHRLLEHPKSGSLLSASEVLLSMPQFASNVSEGWMEDGYAAMQFALGNVPFRKCPSIFHTMVLATDEDRDVSDFSATIVFRDDMLHFIKQQGFSLNVFVDNTFGQAGRGELLGLTSKTTFALNDSQLVKSASNVSEIKGHVFTVKDYTSMALDLGGSAWNINLLGNADADVDPIDSDVNMLLDVSTAQIANQSKNCRLCRCSADGITCDLVANQQSCPRQ